MFILSSHLFYSYFAVIYSDCIIFLVYFCLYCGFQQTVLVCRCAQVLRFFGWLKQTVHESQLEHYRVRHVKLYYYLEDDSIEILEPRVRDSGMPQGH